VHEAFLYCFAAREEKKSKDTLKKILLPFLSWFWLVSPLEGFSVYFEIQLVIYNQLLLLFKEKNDSDAHIGSLMQL